MKQLSSFKAIDGDLKESLRLMHNAVRYGGESGENRFTFESRLW